MNIPAAEYLTQIHNAYTRGRGPLRGVDLLVGEDLFTEFMAGLIRSVREVDMIVSPPQERYLVFKTSRVMVDPTAPNPWSVTIREREDE